MKVADSWRFPCALDGAAFATFNVVFGSTQNDKYSVKTGWCASSDPGGIPAGALLMLATVLALFIRQFAIHQG